MAAQPLQSVSHQSLIRTTNKREGTGRFDRIHTPRLQVEVNLPGYDVRRSMAAAAKRVQRSRQQRQDDRPSQSQQTQEVVSVSLGEAELPEPQPSQQAAPQQPFTINL